jgi:U3 small nucleolar RNA-associated protein 13
MSKGQGFFGESRGGYTSLQSVLVSTTSDTSFDSKSNTDDHCSPKYQHKQLLFVTDAEQNITFYSLLQEGDNNNKLVRPPHSRQQLCSLHTDRTVVGYNDEILDLKIIPNREPHLMSPERMVVVTNSTQIRVYDTHTLACTTVYDEYHTATILGIDVSPCGRYIVTCSKDRSIRLWSTALHNTQCIAVGMGHTDAVGSVALSRKMNLYDISGKAAMNGAGAYCVSVSVDRTVKRWNLPGTMELDATSKSVRSDDNDQNHNNNNNSDNSSILQLTPFSSAHGHEKDINIVAIAPNDSIVATGSQDKTVKLFKASNLAHLATLKGHRRGVWDVCFSPYDRIIATSSGDKSIKLWSLNDYSCVRTFQGHVSSVLRIRFLSGGLQLVSSGADGLVKLWTVRTNETEATMDAHTDRVWALDITKDGKRMISGGADSQIVIWKDTTREMEQAKMAVEEEAILVDQQLANYLRRKEYGDALKISLERDKPHHALKILNAMIEIDVQKGQNGLVSIQNYIKGWNNEQILRMLRYCREWNTRARNSHVALLTVKAIVSTIPIHKLASISGVPEIVAGIIPYLERHYERIDRLHASSYLFDFALSSMGVIDASDTDAIDDYKKWEANSKLMMPPKKVDGRIDVGGNVIVGAPRLVPQSTMHFSDSDDQGNDSDEIITIGESDDSDFE